MVGGARGNREDHPGICLVNIQLRPSFKLWSKHGGSE